MVHHRQRLPLGLESGDDLLGVHAQLDDLERDSPPHRLGLLRDIDHAATAFAHALQNFVAANLLANGFIRRIGDSSFIVATTAGLSFGDNSSGASCAASRASKR